MNRHYFSVSVHESETQKDHNHLIKLAVMCSFSLKCRIMLEFTFIKMRLSDLSLTGHKTFILINTRRFCQCWLTPSSKQSYQFLIFRSSSFSIMKRLFPLILHTTLLCTRESLSQHHFNTAFLFVLLLIRMQRSALTSPELPQELSRQKLINKGCCIK